MDSGEWREDKELLVLSRYYRSGDHAQSGSRPTRTNISVLFRSAMVFPPVSLLYLHQIASNSIKDPRQDSTGQYLNRCQHESLEHH